ncbi:MAG: hypothetical protein II304_00580 [Bacteroidales bacterium]|nr:hypothetical protein [Bacteroidales bacterium]
MTLLIALPDEFEEHFNFDCFQDSLARIKCDIDTYGRLSCRYEIELVEALMEAFKKSKRLED